MVNVAPSDMPVSITRDAERLGVARALTLAPAAVRAAIERAMQPLPSPPSGPLTEPAGVFCADTYADAR